MIFPKPGAAERRRKILLAETPEALKILRDMLDSDFDFLLCTRMAEAREMVAQADVIVCGSHFDECRMLDLLRFCKSEDRLRGKPFVCVRVLGGALDNTLYESVEIASTALGARAFVDLFRWRSQYGDGETAERLRGLVSDRVH